MANEMEIEEKKTKSTKEISKPLAHEFYSIEIRKKKLYNHFSVELKNYN